MGVRQKQGILGTDFLYKRLLALVISILLISTIPIFFHRENRPSQVQATTITVAENGSGDFITLQAAVDNASRGDTILVEPGTYEGNITIRKSLNLIGSGAEDTIITGSFVENIININTSWCNLSGFTFTGYNTYSSISVYGHNNAIRDCISQGSVIGIMLLESDYNLIENCTCQLTTGAGIFIGSSNYNYIRDTSCINSYFGKGIYFTNSYNNKLENGVCNNNPDDGIYSYWLGFGNEILNYSCNNNGKNGIQLLGTDGFIIDNCTANNNGLKGFLIGSNKNSISNCTSMNNLGDGFYISHSEGSSIVDCSSSKNGGNGLYLKYSNENIINRNSFISNSVYGVRVDSNSNENQIYFNDLINNNGVVQALDNNTKNLWYIEKTGNYWWDYPYYYNKASHDGRVWASWYDVNETNNVEDRYPLIKPRIPINKINLVEPGILSDTDSDGVYDLIDEFPNDNSKWRINNIHLFLGPVVDDKDEPIIDAIITFRFNNVTYRNSTDSSGYVIFDLQLEPKEIILNVTLNKKGYEDGIYNVRMNSDGTYSQGEIPKLNEYTRDTKQNPGPSMNMVVIGILFIIFIMLIFIIILKKVKGNNK